MAYTPTKGPKPSSQDPLTTTPRTRDVPEDARKSSCNVKSTPRFRGLDEIKPFLKQIGKIVTEECQKHDSADDIPWYKTWESWNIQDLLAAKSINHITTVICPDLSCNQRTIKAVVNRCTKETPLLNHMFKSYNYPKISYMEITCR